MSDRIERLSTRVAYQSRWLRLREDEIRFPNGTTGLYSYIDKPDFALVMPYENDGFWLVEQFRYTIGERKWEFPQGGWPPGVTGNAAELAAAELREETGAVAAEWQHLGHLNASYGYSNQGYDVFLARALTHGQPEREETEQDMRHEWFSAGKVRTMISDGTLSDGHSVAAWTLFQLSQD
ncbi:MAG: hydrolase [Frankiales bacterium]|nr:hydrolase [Frankiales bacterium]